MARPCGCAGECGCTVVGTNGIAVDGSGTVRDPIRVGLDFPLGGTGCDSVMDCVGSSLGGGLEYAGGNLSAKISGDGGNSIIYGSDLGLYSTGGGGGEDTSVTVASLPATNVVGSHYGAGYNQWPEGLLMSYEAAADMDGINIVHVPVRRSREYFALAAHQRNLSVYEPRVGALTTTTTDLKEWKRFGFKPSGDNQGGDDYFPLNGYFGTGWPDNNRQGGVFLADVFRTLARRRVMYLELKDIGASVGDTPSPLGTSNILLLLIQQYGIQKSVIVGSQIPVTASTPDFDEIMLGLSNIRAAGVEIAAHITSQAEADAITPANLVAEEFKWVFITRTVAENNPAQVTAYKTAGLNVMLIGCYRQCHYELQRTLALRGMLSSDPVYCAGWRSQFRYKQTSARWAMKPDYGRHAYRSDLINVHTSERGYVDIGQTGTLKVQGTLQPPGPDEAQSGYMILSGEQCPIFDPLRNPATPGAYGSPTNYDIEVGFSWSNLVGDRNRWMSVFFGVPKDEPLYEFVRADQNTRGYQFQLNQNGTFIFQRYDGIPYVGTIPPTITSPWQYTDTWASGWGTINPNQVYRIIIQVRPGTVTVGRAGPGGTVVNGHTYTNTDLGGRGERWRGPYFYLGRHFFFPEDSATCRFVDLQTRTF